MPAKKVAITIVGLLSSFNIAVSAAEAATFGFSYAFESGETLSGQFDSDAVEIEPDILSLQNVSNLDAEYSGNGGIDYSFHIPALNIFSLSGTTRLVFGGADIPASAVGTTGNGFRFFAGTGQPGPFGTVTIGEYTPSDSGFGFRPTLEQEVFDPERWQAEIVTEPAPDPVSVPEPDSLLSLLGLGIMGYVLSLRNSKDDVAYECSHIV